MAGKLIGKVAMTAAERQRRWRVRVRKAKAVERIAAKHRAKQRHRVAREAEFAGATVAAAQALEAVGRRAYGVLYIDPPWRPCSFPRRSPIINARAAEKCLAVTPGTGAMPGVNPSRSRQSEWRTSACSAGCCSAGDGRDRPPGFACRPRR